MMNVPMMAAAPATALGPAGLAAAPPATDATSPSGAAPFEQTLDATLREAEPAQPGPAPARRFADPLALAEWLIVGTQPSPVADAAETLDAVELEASPAEEGRPAADGKGDAWWEIPADVLLAVGVPAQPQGAPQTPADVALTAEAAVQQDPALQVGDIVPQPAERVTNAQPLDADETAAAESAAAEVPQRTPSAKALERMPKKDIPAQPRAFEAATTQTVAEGLPQQAAPAATTVPAEPAAKADAAMRVPTRKERQPVVAQAPAQTDATSPEAQAVAAAAAAPAPGTTTAQGQETVSPHGSRAAASHGRADSLAPTLQSALASTGDDAGSFEQEGRRSFAGQRLAAALSAQPAAAAGDAGASVAPAFSVTPAAPAAAAAPVTAAVPVGPAMPAETPDLENVASLIEAMRTTVKGGGWEATVRLKPHHFGEVTIQLKVEGSSVSATVSAESAGVRQWLQSQEESVRSGMAEHGLQLDRFQVSRDGQRREADEPPPQQTPRRRQPQRAGAAEPRFEVVV